MRVFADGSARCKSDRGVVMRVFLTLCASLLLAGCGTVVKDRSQTPMSPMGGFGTSLGTGKTNPPPGRDPKTWNSADIVTIDVPGFLDSYSGKSSNGNFERALAGFSAGDREKLKLSRNEIVGALLMASEKNCEVYLQYLRGNQVAIKGFSTMAASILAGAATVTTPERSSKLLAALAGISTGVGGNLADAVFSSRAADAIVSGINAERAAVKSELLGRMEDSYEAWPVSLALAGVVTYHSRCSAVSGLAYLQGSAEGQKKTTETPNAVLKQTMVDDAVKAALTPETSSPDPAAPPKKSVRPGL